MQYCHSRYEVIQKLCAGKNVLDVGSTGQTDAYNLWKVLSKSAQSLHGIDTELSNNPAIVRGDMERHPFGMRFDVIIAGDVIEHVMNQGLFLDNCRKHLKEGGRLVVTTPNAKWPTVFLRPNPTHTAWHDRFTLAYLLKQVGFHIELFAYYPGNKPRYSWFVKPLVLRQGLLVVAVPQ